MQLMSLKDWNLRGQRVKDNARSFARGPFGVALFSQDQVVPFDRPLKRNIIEVNGRFYREI